MRQRKPRKAAQPTPPGGTSSDRGNVDERQRSHQERPSPSRSPSEVAMSDLSFKHVGIEDPDLLNVMSFTATDRVPLSFVLKWTIGKAVSLFLLHGRAVGTNDWRNLIQHAANENDGEIVIPIGHHMSGTTIELRFGVFPFEDVPKIATFIHRPGLVEQFKPEPTGRTQQLKRAEAWRDSGPYKI